MIKEIRREIVTGGLPEKAPPTDTQAAASVRWLGQAGFLIEWSGRLVIDPYLSDFLAKKYKGKKFEHKRMMQPPFGPGELRGIDFYFCTHNHSDHMDPETIQAAVRNNPDARFVVPASQSERAGELGVPAGRIVGIDGGGGARLCREAGGTGSPITVEAVPAAHEELEQDEEGRYLFVGYIIRLPGFTVYHSGDCVPYPGLAQTLVRAGGIDLALLPVNGRDRCRLENGIVGNFTVPEALELCTEAGIPYLIPHHFGMFDFNTVPVEEIRTGTEGFQEAAGQNGRTVPEVIIPEEDCRYNIFP